jgi:hypothetical protein
MNYIKKNIYLVLIPLLAIISCDDGFEGVNSNPNEPEEVNAAVLMTSATRASMRSMVNESFLLSNNIAQVTAKTLRTEADSYDFNAFTTLWLDQYNALRDFKDAELTAEENENFATQAAAIIMQSNVFYTLTMSYGDIPYSEAISGTTDGNYTPAYDAQEVILDGQGGLLERLQEANSLLDQAANNGQSVEGDLIFDGSPQQWMKLSNVIQLRIINHLSNKRDVSSDMNSLINGGMLFGSNADNADLDYLGSFPNVYPLFPLKQGDFDAVVMSEQSVDLMQNYSDPRLGEYARPDNVTDLGTFDSMNAEYTGAENGSETGGCDKGGSRLGARYYDYPGHPTGSERASAIIATYSEQELIIAEAIQKGIVSGDAEMHYMNGIQASMEYYSVNVDVFGWNSFMDFYNNSGVAYDGSLDKIWEQKWLATFFHGMEPYFDSRRMVMESNGGSGFDVNAVPFLEAPCSNANNGNMPTRFLYPGNEISLNNENYIAAINEFEDEANTQNGVIWIVE